VIENCHPSGRLIPPFFDIFEDDSDLAFGATATEEDDDTGVEDEDEDDDEDDDEADEDKGAAAFCAIFFTLGALVGTFLSDVAASV
jgi:hypothetical protein